MRTELTALSQNTSPESTISCLLSNRPLSATDKVKVVVSSVFLAVEVGAMVLGTYILTHGLSEHSHDNIVTGSMIILGGIFFGTVTVAIGCLNISRRNIEV